MEDDFTINYLGKTITLNQNLIIKLNLSETQIKDIKQLHRQAISCDISLTEIAHLGGSGNTEILLEHWHDIQYQLQDAWGFERNIKFHKFWKLTSCSCPKMDNDDRYPSGYYVMSGKCALHGKEIKEKANV